MQLFLTNLCKCVELLISHCEKSSCGVAVLRTDIERRVGTGSEVVCDRERVLQHLRSTLFRPVLRHGIVGLGCGSYPVRGAERRRFLHSYVEKLNHNYVLFPFLVFYIVGYSVTNTC